MKNTKKLYFFLLTYAALFVYSLVGYMLFFGITDWYIGKFLFPKLLSDSIFFSFLFAFYLLIPAYAGMKLEQASKNKK